MRGRAWAVVAAVWLCACTLTTVQRDHTEPVFIPAGSGPISGDLGLDLGDLGADEVDEGDIQGIALNTFEIKSVTPGADVAFLDRIDVFVEAAGLPRVLIASGTDFPAGATTVKLEPEEDVELADYLLGDNFQVITLVNGRMPPTDTDLDVHVVVDVGVTPKGACNALQPAGSDEDAGSGNVGASSSSTGTLGG
jgi:hypothetical protein